MNEINNIVLLENVFLLFLRLWTIQLLMHLCDTLICCCGKWLKFCGTNWQTSSLYVYFLNCYSHRMISLSEFFFCHNIVYHIAHIYVLTIEFLTVTVHYSIIGSSGLAKLKMPIAFIKPMFFNFFFFSPCNFCLSWDLLGSSLLKSNGRLDEWSRMQSQLQITFFVVVWGSHQILLQFGWCV